MAKRVLQYRVPVDDRYHIFHLSADSPIVHVGVRSPDPNTDVLFWAVTDDDEVLGVPRAFIICGTGHDLPDDPDVVGTVIAAGGRLVWHLVEVPVTTGYAEVIQTGTGIPQ